MAKIVSAVGHARPTKHGKRLLALSMYKKGTSFLGAALLLRQRGRDEYVALHLMCQGIEIVMKGVLLIVDYDKFKPQLRTLGHNLVTTTDAAMKAAGLPAFCGAARTELITLSRLYSRHMLRYGSTHDVFIDPRTIPHRRVLRRTGALLRRLQRKGIPNAKAI